MTVECTCCSLSVFSSVKYLHSCEICSEFRFRTDMHPETPGRYFMHDPDSKCRLATNPRFEYSSLS